MNTFLVSTVNDTLSVVLKEDLVDFYKDIAGAQSNQFTILLTAILGVFAVMIGATWWWNYRGAKAQIDDEMKAAKKGIEEFNAEIDQKFNKFKQEVLELIDQKIEASIDALLSQKLDEYTDRTELIDKKNEEKLNQFQEKVDKEITTHQAELNRVFALHCETLKVYYQGFSWWLSAFELYLKLDQGHLAQVSIKEALSALKNVKKEDVNKKELPSYIERVKNGVPDILSSERKELLGLLNKLGK